MYMVKYMRRLGRARLIKSFQSHRGETLLGGVPRSYGLYDYLSVGIKSIYVVGAAC